MCDVLSLIRVKSFYKDTFDKQSFLMCHSDSFLLTFTSALLLTAFRFHSIKGVQSSLRVECFPPTHLSLSHTHTHTHTHTQTHRHTHTCMCVCVCVCVYVCVCVCVCVCVMCVRVCVCVCV